MVSRCVLEFEKSVGRRREDFGSDIGVILKSRSS